ncbi:exosome complex component Rrp40 [Oratosquilla oratoria]|uniref:exosome complex component Rrp40 n=1 Tax=Oratosquilla oratoria TaxID=337810 RepID=UPI003F7596C2
MSKKNKSFSSGNVESLQTVLPGDVVLQLNLDVVEKVLVGPGLKLLNGVVQATKPGILKKDGRNMYYVDIHHKRYIPQRREFIIGIVLKKRGDNYMVDIGSSEAATISYLSFENASKKTRKEMKPGDLLYAQIIRADKDTEPELVCIDLYSRAVGMGSLPEGGLIMTVPLHVARSIISPKNPFLLELSKYINYSIVVGFNGRIWVKADKETEMLAVMHCVELLEHVSLEEAIKMVPRLVSSIMSMGV